MTESEMTEKSGWTRRSFLVRSSILGSAAVGAPALLSACASGGGGSGGGSDTLSKAKKAGYINVGIAGEIPYGYTDKSGKVTGQAPVVAAAIFKTLGVPRLKAKQVDFDSLIQSLDAGDFDMVAAGMDILPARCKHATFSIPDYQALVAFLVPKGNPKGINNFNDVIAKKVPVGVEIGAVEAGFATQAGVPSSQIQNFSSQDQLFSAVKTGRVYAAVLTDISWRAVVAQNPTAGVEMATPFIPKGGQPETGGFSFRKNETALLNAFNTQLAKLHSSGEWTRLVQPFFFTSQNIPPSNVTTQKLCSA